MDLRCGDCLEEMTYLDDDSVDLLFADLPYGQTSCAWDCEIDLDKFWEQANRVCKKDAPMIFTCSVKFGNTLINSNPKNFRYDLVWVKSKKVGFLSAKKCPLRSHEMIYVFYRSCPSAYQEAIAKYHKHKFLNEDKSNYKCESEIYEGKTLVRNPPINRKSAIYEPSLPHSLLAINSENGLHPTQKPVALLEWIIKYYTREDAVVLDPTMGSGTTGIACKSLNRNFIGIEKNETYYEVAFERLVD